MKSVQRVNEREEKHRRLQQGHLPKSPQAVSAVDKVNHTEAKIRKEIAIMKKLRHPHVVRLYEVIDDRMREKIYIGALFYNPFSLTSHHDSPVMEYLGGGEVLWKGPHKNPLLTIDQTRRIMRDAVLGLEYRSSFPFSQICLSPDVHLAQFTTKVSSTAISSQRTSYTPLVARTSK